MRILITGDVQADAQNLELCQQAWDEILDSALAEKIQAIVIAGDLKHDYNPCDLRVIKWWQRAIVQATNEGISVLANLGNHDRLGQYNDKENWFPILRKAGATCIDKGPEVLNVGDGQVALLPFCRKKDVLKERAEWLSKEVRRQNSVLIFHEEIREARYNVTGRKSENGIELEALHPGNYEFVVGGHFHLHQKIGKNAYYVGSPFATDWGEANQKKGFIIIKNGEFRFCESKLPGWFDPTWPGYWEPKSWKGCNVRLHAKCRNANEYARILPKLRADAEQKYAGADIFITAEFDGVGGRSEGLEIKSSDPDEVKIREYVKETCPDKLKQKEICDYLLSKIDTKWNRSGTGIKIVRATAKNFLSFRELEVDWGKRGITIVQGKNKDRLGKSNGAGKTTLLQTIPVSLFGTTFKGQKHDGWARRNAEGKTSVHLEIRDGRNRRIEIERGRKPTKLQLWVDGKDRSIGMNPQLKEATQGEIEKLTGFTWQTLANAVYIDQEVARTFLSGTKKQRTEVLSKFQNLERFERALLSVRKDRADSEEREKKVQTRITVLNERVKQLERRQEVLLEESEARTREAWKEVRERKKFWETTESKLAPKIKEMGIQAEKLKDGFEASRKELVVREARLSKWIEKESRYRFELVKVRKAKELSNCPTCLQTVNMKMLEKLEADLLEKVNGCELVVQRRNEAVKSGKVECVDWEATYDSVQRDLEKLKDEVHRAKFGYEDTYNRYLDMKRREHTESQAKFEVKRELKNAREKKQSWEQELMELSGDKEFYSYCERAMSRDGIPSFLNALLCPTLNLASDYYAELFGDKAIQVRFEMENGDFVPKILNATGGEDIDDQSDGEKALAGLISSFAMRDAAPKCNILILDEPGHGLDPSTAKQLARGLKELTNKFESIWLTTHNVHIQQELESENSLLVVKRNGISKLVN